MSHFGLLSAFFIIQLHAQEQSNIQKCNVEYVRINDVTAMLENYKKDCRKFPTSLSQLIENSEKCKTWGLGQKGPYMADTPVNREFLKSYSYSKTKNTFTLLPMDCPN